VSGKHGPPKGEWLLTEIRLVGEAHLIRMFRLLRAGKTGLPFSMQYDRVLEARGLINVTRQISRASAKGTDWLKRELFPPE